MALAILKGGRAHICCSCHQLFEAYVKLVFCLVLQNNKTCNGMAAVQQMNESLVGVAFSIVKFLPPPSFGRHFSRRASGESSNYFFFCCCFLDATTIHHMSHCMWKCTQIGKQSVAIFHENYQADFGVCLKLPSNCWPKSRILWNFLPAQSATMDDGLLKIVRTWSW